MNAQLLTMLLELIKEFHAATGTPPAVIKMSPATMSLWLDGQTLTTVGGVPVVRNQLFPFGAILALDDTNLDAEGDLT